jgi:large conductance mechanosensitive channel
LTDIILSSPLWQVDVANFIINYIKQIKVMGKFIQEFKEFAVKGNAVDMAVGVIIGGAFGKIVSSIVDDLIMPPIGWLIGGVNFTDLKIKLPAEKIADGIQMQAATINIGSFVQNLIDFIIIDFCVFLLVKGINKLAGKKNPQPEAPAVPEPSNEEKLLGEIRDLLKNK